MDAIANRDRERLMTKGELLALTGLTYPTIWRMMMAGTFPRSRKISERRVGWLASEVVSWMRGCPVQPLKNSKHGAVR
jgi:prophage regulatory protein